MKNFLAAITIFSGAFLGNQVCAQEYLEPQWKFYFAFEDATGARDTVWHVMDSSVTSWGLLDNVHLGVVPFEVPDSVFSVYMGFGEMPATKITPSNIEQPSNSYIYASNYSLPITLSWDTALFNATVLQETVAGPICNPRMDSEWFFGQTNAPWLHNMYSMVFDNHVVLPEFWWGSQNHFPITAYFSRAHNCNPLSTESTSRGHSLEVHPNPCTDFVLLRSGAVLQEVEVYSLQGRKLLQQPASSFTGSSQEMRIDVAALPPGMYVFQAVAADGRRGSARFVKVE